MGQQFMACFFSMQEICNCIGRNSFSEVKHADFTSAGFFIFYFYFFPLVSCNMELCWLVGNLTCLEMYSPPTHHRGAHTVQDDSNGENRSDMKQPQRPCLLGEILIATDFALSVQKHPISLGSLQLHFHRKLYSSDKSVDKIQHLKGGLLFLFERHYLPVSVFLELLFFYHFIMKLQKKFF